MSDTETLEKPAADLTPSFPHRVLSGMQPTNNLHLGNYLGALVNWVKMQHDYESLFCIVDFHALTTQPDPKILRQNIREIAAAYIAAGVDPQKNAIFAQSQVPGHAELSWIFSCHTPLGWLNRMTQFKEKAGNKKDQAVLGLYSYPVLMAADILLYRATHVPVGEDQKQHLELSRDIAGAFNRFVDQDYFPLPEPQILGEATRVMSLRDGEKKMSKSDESDYSRINLTDDSDTIALKFRKAKSDMHPLPATVEELEGRPEAKNLVAIYAALSGEGSAAVLNDFAGKQFSDFKPALTELAVAKLSPITQRMNELLADPAEIDRILARGSEKASAIASETMKDVKALIGLPV